MENEARAELSTALGTVIHEVKMHAYFERELETYATLLICRLAFSSTRSNPGYAAAQMAFWIQMEECV